MESRYFDSFGNPISRSTYESLLAQNILLHSKEWHGFYSRLNNLIADVIDHNKSNADFNKAYETLFQYAKQAYPEINKEDVVKRLRKEPLSPDAKDVYPNRFAFLIYKGFFEKCLPIASIVHDSHLLAADDKKNEKAATYQKFTKDIISSFRPHSSLFSPLARGREIMENVPELGTFDAGITSEVATPKELKNIYPHKVATGKTGIRRIPESPTVQLFEQNDLPFIAGPSGTLSYTIRALQALFAEIKPEEFKAFFMVMTASMVFDGHHSFAETGLVIDIVSKEQEHKDQPYNMNFKLPRDFAGKPHDEQVINPAKAYYDQFLTDEYRFSDAYVKFCKTHPIRQYSAMTWEILADACYEYDGKFAGTSNHFFEHLKGMLNENKARHGELSVTDLKKFITLLKKHEAQQLKNPIYLKLTKKITDSGILIHDSSIISWRTVHEYLRSVPIILQRKTNEKELTALKTLFEFAQENVNKKGELKSDELVRLIKLLWDLKKSQENEIIFENFAKKFSAAGINLNDLTAKDELGDTLLFRAIKQGNVSFAKALIREVDQKADAKDTRALFLTIEKNHLDLLSQMLESGADAKAVNENGMTLLQFAVMHENAEAAKILLNAGANLEEVNEEGFTLLWQALLARNESAAKLLIELGANPLAINKKTNEVLFKFVIRAYPHLFTSTFAQKINANAVDEEGESLLIDATKQEKLPVVKALVDAKADVNFCNKNNGMTALHYAAQELFLDVTKVLLEGNANVNATNHEGETPLLLAMKSLSFMGERTRYVEKLLEYKANTDIASKETGFCALHYAVESGDLETAALLLSAKANVNQTDLQGNTPLHLAVENGNAAMVKLLSERGASHEVKNAQGRLPQQLSKVLEISKYLQDKQSLAQLPQSVFGADVKQDRTDTRPASNAEPVSPNGAKKKN